MVDVRGWLCCRGWLGLQARRDVYVRSDEIRAQAEREFKEREGGAGGGGGGDGAAVPQRAGPAEREDSGVRAVGFRV